MICQRCSCREPEVRFNENRKICTSCRRKRSEYLRVNPSAQKLPKRITASNWNRLLARRKVTPTGCWEWTGYRNAFGYGRISSVIINGRKKSLSAHRLAAYLKLELDISDRYSFACHRCDNPACFNPAHLFIGTPLENSKDCVAKKRMHPSHGESNGGGRKLKTGEVLKIREKYRAGNTQSFLAAEYGIDQTMVSRIVLRKAWSQA